MEEMGLFQIALIIASTFLVYIAAVFIGLYLSIWVYKQISGNRITPAGDKISEEGETDHDE